MGADADPTPCRYTIRWSRPSGPAIVSGGGGSGSRGQPVDATIRSSKQRSHSGIAPRFMRTGRAPQSAQSGSSALVGFTAST